MFLGSGAYFADDPRKSHNYTSPAGAPNSARVMYYNKVVLGIGISAKST